MPDLEVMVRVAPGREGSPVVRIPSPEGPPHWGAPAPSELRAWLCLGCGHAELFGVLPEGVVEWEPLEPSGAFELTAEIAERARQLIRRVKKTWTLDLTRSENWGEEYDEGREQLLHVLLSPDVRLAPLERQAREALLAAVDAQRLSEEDGVELVARRAYPLDAAAVELLRHGPAAFADTVLSRRRSEADRESLPWRCPSCAGILHDPGCGRCPWCHDEVHPREAFRG
jgi:hypothetical protein